MKNTKVEVEPISLLGKPKMIYALPCEGSRENRDTIASREVCTCCDADITVGFTVPDKIWNQVAKKGEQLCLSCFTRKADRHLIRWDENIQFYPVSLISHLEYNL